MKKIILSVLLSLIATSALAKDCIGLMPLGDFKDSSGTVVMSVKSFTPDNFTARDQYNREFTFTLDAMSCVLVETYTEAKNVYFYTVVDFSESTFSDGTYLTMKLVECVDSGCEDLSLKDPLVLTAKNPLMVQ